MSSELDTVFGELMAISDELKTLGPGDDARRTELEARRAELRAAAQHAADASRPKAALEAELAHLEQMRAKAEGQHIDIVAQTSGAMADTVGDLQSAREINKMLDENAGLDEIEARIAQIKAVLAESNDE